jgi:hypothetical protein
MFSFEGKLGIITELCVQSLAKAIKGKRGSGATFKDVRSQMVRAMVEIAEGLCCLHSKGPPLPSSPSPSSPPLPMLFSVAFLPYLIFANKPKHWEPVGIAHGDLKVLFSTLF